MARNGSNGLLAAIKVTNRDLEPPGRADRVTNRDRTGGAGSPVIRFQGLRVIRPPTMASTTRKPAPKPENLVPLVLLVRNEKILLDSDLAGLYGVGTKVLNQAVRRNAGRFPPDFMFQLTADETARLRSQIVTSRQPATAMRSQSVTASRRNIGALPYAFTEQGVAMLSSILRSPRAVEVNIAIMRTFVQLRRLMDSNRELARRIEALERRYDEKFDTVFDAIKRLIAEDDARKAKPKRSIGFLD